MWLVCQSKMQQSSCACSDIRGFGIRCTVQCYPSLLLLIPRGGVGYCDLSSTCIHNHHLCPSLVLIQLFPADYDNLTSPAVRWGPYLQSCQWGFKIYMYMDKLKVPCEKNGQLNCYFIHFVVLT